MRHLTPLFLFVALLLPVGPAAAQDGRPWKSGTVAAADDVSIHYLEGGSGPAMLFVPGWTMPAWIWEPQLAHFAKSRRVVAMDPRAQGESSQTADGLHPAARARDIKAVIDALRLSPVVLVGWSLGVTEIAAYVKQFGTGTLSAIVLVDGIAGGEFDPAGTPAMLQMLGSLQQNRRAFTAEFVRGMFERPQPAAYLERLTAAALRTPESAAVALVVGAMTQDNRSALTAIDKPALIVGTRGAFTSAYEEMRDRIPSARLEIFDDAGHALFVDEPERFNTILERFLEPLPR